MDAILRTLASNVYEDVIWIVVVSNNHLPLVLGPKPNLDILSNVGFFEVVDCREVVAIPALGYD
jgi:hypothetical protein